MRLTKKNIEAVVVELISDALAWEETADKKNRVFNDGYTIGKRAAASRLYQAFISENRDEYLAFKHAIEDEYAQKKAERTGVKAEKTAKKEEPKTVKNAAPIRSMEEPKKAVKTAKKTETAPKTTAKKTTKRAVKKAAEIVPINAASGTPFTGKNAEKCLEYLKKNGLTDGRFYTWNGKADAGYRVKAGQSGLRLAYFGKASRGVFHVWHISQLVKTVDASAAEEVKETIKREITLDDDGGNGKKKVFKVTIRK